MSKLQEMSTHFMDNILEYETLTSCQTLAFWNQTGSEIFFVDSWLTNCSLNILCY